MYCMWNKLGGANKFLPLIAANMTFDKLMITNIHKGPIMVSLGSNKGPSTTAFVSSEDES